MTGVLRTDSPLLAAARAYVLKGLELGAANSYPLLAERPDLAVQISENPRLAADETILIYGGTVVRGVEIATMTQARGTEEFMAFQAAMRDDAEVGAVIGQWVATAAYGGTITAHDVAVRLLWCVMSRTGFYPDARVIDHEIGRMMAAIVSEFFDVRHVAPIYGLNLGGDLPLVINSNHAIDFLASDELEVVAGQGFGHDPRSPVRQLGQVLGLRQRLELRRVVGGEASQEDKEKLARFPTDSEESAERVLAALRLFKPGRLYVPGGVVIGHDAVTGGGWAWGSALGSGRPRAGGVDYSVGGDECEQLAAFIGDCDRARKSKAIANGLRRFSYAADRSRPDDELIDLMIAAESLFLSDEGDVGELKHRLAQRAALYIEGSTLTAREVLGRMHDAYKVRSQVVHGSTPKIPRTPDGTPLSFSEFVGTVEALLRLALRKAVRQTSAQGEFAVDWDSLLFPEESTV